MAVNSDEVVRATLEMHYESFGAIQNVFYMQNVGATVPNSYAVADIIEMLETLCDIIQAVIAVLQIVDGVRIVNVTSLADVGYGTFVDPTPFEGAGTIFPTQCAVGLNLTTSRLNVNGRKYFGALAIAALSSGGLLTSTALTPLALAGDEMTEQFDATYTEWRYGVVATLDSVFLPFQNYTIPTMAIIQRRRRLGVGI